MKIKNLKFKISEALPASTIIFFAVILRILPHPPNVAPITALALFGGVYLNKKLALIIPITVMIISDFFIGFHNTMLFVYGSFLLIGVMGLWIKNHKSLKHIAAASFISSVLFYLITNFGVWLVSGMYEQSINGLIKSYMLALPFFRYTIIGDFLFTAIFFTAYELILKLIKTGAKSPSILKRETNKHS